MMSVYRETGQASPGSSGSRMLIIHRRKSGIRLPCYTWKSGGQNLHSNRVNLIEQLGFLHRGVYSFLEMGENESGVPSPSQQGKHVQPAKCWAVWRFGALSVSACGSLFCCRLLQRVLRVHARGCVFACACVLGEGGNPQPSCQQYIAFKKTLQELEGKGRCERIRISIQHCVVNKGCFKLKVICGRWGYHSVKYFSLLEIIFG